MSPRSASSFSDGEVVSGNEEKAISTITKSAKDGKVNTSARLVHVGSSLRASHWDGPHATQRSRLRDDADNIVTHTRDASRSPYRRDRSRSRSPYRAGRGGGGVGEKRRHEDDHYSRRGASDPRRFKVHYEGGPSSRGLGYNSRRPYRDPDRPRQPNSASSYDDGEGIAREHPYLSHRDHERDRDRSRSPFRHDKSRPLPEHRNGSQKDRDGGDWSHRPNVSELASRNQRRSAIPNRERGPSPHHARERGNGKVERSLPQQPKSVPPAPEHAQSSAEPPDATNEPRAELSEAEVIEQRRKRREAIKARHKTNPPLLVQALEQSMPAAAVTPSHDTSGAASEQQSPPSSIESPRTPQPDSPPGSPAAFAVTDDEELIDRRQVDNAAAEEEGPSAADYDPNMDMEEDRPDHKRQDLHDHTINGISGENAEVKAEDVPTKSKEFDMFANDDDDDMFAPAGTTAKATVSTKRGQTLDQSLLDNWDYPDGHYRIMLGELLDGRYAVQQQIGKGTFATVIRALDTRTDSAVAVKIACNNDTMYKAGQKEMDMLRVLNQNDPEDKKHVIRLLRHFEHKGHLCLVFENLSADLREVLKKFGRNIGLNLKAIRSYAQQMFLALSLMKKCQILHADLKPDNILVSEKRSLLKVCDLGTAAFAYDAEVTPYLVSRFYRAPEVILGIPFDHAIDMWSIGCTLFELYTGRILFAGADNNQMLRTIQECRGKFPIRMLKRSTLADRHFDVDGNFFSQERDKITGKAIIRQVHFRQTERGKDLKSRLSTNMEGMTTQETKELAGFVDLMDRCLQLDPAKRVSPNEALRHPFVAHSTSQLPLAEKTKEHTKLAMSVSRIK